MAVQIRRQHLMQVPTMLRHVILYAPSCEYLMRGPCNVIKHTEYGYDTLVAAEGRYIAARRVRVQTLVRLRMHVPWHFTLCLFSADIFFSHFSYSYHLFLVCRQILRLLRRQGHGSRSRSRPRPREGPSTLSRRRSYRRPRRIPV